jgi:hypothetical protein
MLYKNLQIASSQIGKYNEIAFITTYMHDNIYITMDQTSMIPSFFLSLTHPFRVKPFLIYCHRIIYLYTAIYRLQLAVWLTFRVMASL